MPTVLFFATLTLTTTLVHYKCMILMISTVICFGACTVKLYKATTAQRINIAQAEIRSRTRSRYLNAALLRNGSSCCLIRLTTKIKFNLLSHAKLPLQTTSCLLARMNQTNRVSDVTTNFIRGFKCNIYISLEMVTWHTFRTCAR